MRTVEPVVQRLEAGLHGASNFSGRWFWCTMGVWYCSCSASTNSFQFAGMSAWKE